MEADDARTPGQELDTRLEEFLERLTPSLGRPDRRRQARTYVAGLLLDGERKSVQPLAGRLGATDNGQALHHFVAHSAWACEGLFVAMAQEATRLWPRPHAWIIDETSFPKAGSHSVGVAPQYCGALGKISHCQVAVSLHYAARPAAGQTGSAALGWRLFLPREWIDDPARRQKAGVPGSSTYHSKNALALELVDEALARGLPPAPGAGDLRAADLGRPGKQVRGKDAQLPFLRLEGVANVQGIASLPQRRLERRLGVLPKETMEQIKNTLRFALDL